MAAVYQIVGQRNLENVCEASVSGGGISQEGCPVNEHPGQIGLLVRHQVIKIGPAQHGSHGPDQLQQLIIPYAVIDPVGITPG